LADDVYAEFDALLKMSTVGEGAGPPEELSDDEREQLARDVEDWERRQGGSP
jgi:hypothetical protein